MKNLFLILITVFSFSAGNAQTSYKNIFSALVKSSENNFTDIMGEKLSSKGYITTYSSKIKFGIGQEFIDKLPENTLGNIFTLTCSDESSQYLESQILDFVRENFTGEQYSISLDSDKETGHYNLIIIRKGTAKMFMLAEKKYNPELKVNQYELKLYGKE